MADIIEARIAFSRRSALVWLLIANAAVFVVLRLIAAAGVVGSNENWLADAVGFLTLPTSLSSLVIAPWKLVTYMFTQFDVSHIMFNMLWLAWFGMLMQIDFGSRRLIASYFIGGIAGAVAYMILGVMSPVVNPASYGLIGSSAAVASVALSLAVAEPEKRVDLLFLGYWRLKWVTVVMVAIALLFFSGHNPGSDAAHAGGALAGLILGIIYRVRPLPTGLHKRSVAALTDEMLLNQLLDKTRRSGFDSLSPEERTELFNVSKRLNDSRRQ